MKHLLLIPAPTTRLLDPGICGARPPQVVEWRDSGGVTQWLEIGIINVTGAGRTRRRALPLIWNGVLTGELGLVRPLKLVGEDWCCLNPIRQKDMLRVAGIGEATGLWTVEVIE